MMIPESYHGFVFLTTNMVNGMLYVGQTTKRIENRYMGSGRDFLKAVKEYGRGNFNRVILAFANDQLELDNIEEYYTLKFNSDINGVGYNIIVGTALGKKGEGSSTKLATVRVKMSKSQKERHQRKPELKENTSKFMKEMYANDPEFKERNKEHLQEVTKNRESKYKNNPQLKKSRADNLNKNVAKAQQANKKPVIGTNKKTDEVREFSSMKKAAEILKELGYKVNPGDIGSCCISRYGYKSTGGWTWKFKNN